LFWRPTLAWPIALDASAVDGAISWLMVATRPSLPENKNMIRDVIIPTFHARLAPADWNELIADLSVRGQHPILVIGQNGDEILLNCPVSRDTDLVFDAETQSTFWTSLFAGAQAVDGAAYVFDPTAIGGAKALVSDTKIWAQIEFDLRDVLYRNTPGVMRNGSGELWLLNSSAMRVVRESPAAQLPALVASWMQVATLARTSLP
jgi:hypothetical protein